MKKDVSFLSIHSHVDQVIHRRLSGIIFRPFFPSLAV